VTNVAFKITQLALSSLGLVYKGYTQFNPKFKAGAAFGDLLSLVGIEVSDTVKFGMGAALDKKTGMMLKTEK